jgi:hypothetical protein
MRRVLSVDASTGEILDGAVVGVFYPQRRNGFGTEWLAMAQNPLMELAKLDLGDEARRVLFAVLAKLDFENYLMLNQAQLSAELGLKSSNFNRALARLEAEGILARGPKAGRSSTFRLNPNLGWKGSASNHRKALAERMKARNMTVVSTDGQLREELEQAGQERFEGV